MELKNSLERQEYLKLRLSPIQQMEKKKPSSVWEVKKEARVFLAVVLGPIVRSCKTKQSKKVVFVKKNEKQFDLTLLDLLVCKNTNAG